MIQYLHSMEFRLETGGVDTLMGESQMKGAGGAGTRTEWALCLLRTAQHCLESRF